MHKICLNGKQIEGKQFKKNGIMPRWFGDFSLQFWSPFTDFYQNLSGVLQNWHWLKIWRLYFICSLILLWPFGAPRYQMQKKEVEQEGSLFRFSSDCLPNRDTNADSYLCKKPLLQEVREPSERPQCQLQCNNKRFMDKSKKGRIVCVTLPPAPNSAAWSETPPSWGKERELSPP